MKKLSLDALMERSNEVASEELMSQITGGIEDACHIVLPDTTMPQDNTYPSS